MTLRQKQAVFAQNVAKLIDHIFSLKLSCTFGDAFRSELQARENAIKGIGIANSLHCKRLAIDLNLFDSGGKYIRTYCSAFQKIGDYWESLDAKNRWGGGFVRVDLNHFEMQE